MSGYPAWSDVEGFTIEVEPALSGRDEFVPIPVRFRAVEKSGEVGRTVSIALCVTPTCDARELVRLKTGTVAAPAPTVTRVLSLANGLIAVDQKGRQHSLLDGVHTGNGIRVALIGDEPLVFPAATLLSSDGVASASQADGISPFRTDRALIDEPSLVHAFTVISVAPATDLPAPLVVELRRFLHAGHVVVGDAALRSAIVHMRDDSVNKEEAFSGAKKIERVGREIAPPSTATLVAVPSGQPLRVGARGPLPLTAYDEHGGLFLERRADATGDDVIDAILHERPWLAAGRMMVSRQAYGDTRGLSAAVALVARMMPVWISYAFMAAFGLIVLVLVLRHRGRRSRTAFIVESTAVSLILVVAILVTARVRSATATDGEVVVWTQKHGASLTHEARVRTARAASTGDRISIPGEPSRAQVAEVRGDPVDTPLLVERLPDGGFAMTSNVDVALAVVSTGLVRLNGALTVNFDDASSPISVTNTTPFAFDEVRVQVSTETKVARGLAPNATVTLASFDYAPPTGDVDDRMVVARMRLMQDLSNRSSVQATTREKAHSIIAVGHSGTRVYGLEVLP